MFRSRDTHDVVLRLPHVMRRRHPTHVFVSCVAGAAACTAAARMPLMYVSPNRAEV